MLQELNGSVRCSGDALIASTASQTDGRRPPPDRPQRESNLRPRSTKSGALPTELVGRDFRSIRSEIPPYRIRYYSPRTPPMLRRRASPFVLRRWIRACRAVGREGYVQNLWQSHAAPSPPPPPPPPCHFRHRGYPPPRALPGSTNSACPACRRPSCEPRLPRRRPRAVAPSLLRGPA